MNTEQEYWDACLIKTWRNAGTVLDAIQMYSSITGKDAEASSLLRFPPYGYPWKTGVRVFVAEYLYKISDRLWNQAPDKDVLLLKKLATSKYDATKSSAAPDMELKAEMRRNKTNTLRNAMATLAVSNRNNDTNGNIVKGGVKRKRIR